MWTPGLLIGDDDRLLRETLDEVFRPRGFRTFLAADGRKPCRFSALRKFTWLFSTCTCPNWVVWRPSGWSGRRNSCCRAFLCLPNLTKPSFNRLGG